MKWNPFPNSRKILGTNGILLIIIAAVILEFISIVQYQYAHEEIAVDLHLRAQSELLAKSLAIQNIMSQVESAVGNHVWDAERLINEADSSYSVVRRLVEMNPDIVGSSFTFIPNYYPEKGYWFESYAVRNDAGGIDTMQLGFADHDYTVMDFYRIPIETDSSRWTDPYLDSDGAKMLLTTYSKPIHDSSGKPVAVLDADISLDWLKGVLDMKYVHPSSYSILISRSGQLMSYPNPDYVMHKTLADVASEMKDTTLREINRKMMAGQSGNAKMKGNDGETYHVFYSPVGGHTGWSIAVVNSEKEIYGHYNRIRNILLSLSVLAVLILMFIIYRSIRNINKLHKVTIERERIGSELKIAREIQMGMLPKNDVVSVSDGRIEVATLLEPAKEVGGDLYDFFIKDDHFYFCIGDVSGKGIPASMFMTVTRNLFRTISPYTRNASKVLWYMNQTLADVNESNMFVTFFVGILDLNTGELNYTNAGHDGPVIIDGKGTRIMEVTPNLPLGVMSDFRFADEKTVIKSGTLIFLYTDGLTEAMNIDKKEFGEKGMIEAVNEVHVSESGTDPEELINSVAEEVKRFVGKAEQSDDLTMVAFRYQKREEKPNERKIILKNELPAVTELREFVDRLCEEGLFPLETSMKLQLVLEEAVVNIINYAYPDGTEGEIEVIIRIAGGKVNVILRDKGVEFDPTGAPEVDTSASAEEREIGGLGIFLIREMSEEVSYRREGDKNVMELVINI